MPPSRQPRAAARGARIFGGFLRFSGSIPESGFIGSRPAFARSNTGYHGQPVAGQMPVITASASGAGHHGQRLAAHPARLTFRKS